MMQALGQNLRPWVTALYIVPPPSNSPILTASLTDKTLLVRLRSYARLGNL
jgi:hypothetical protein